jgi:hypothetical protein
LIRFGIAIARGHERRFYATYLSFRKLRAILDDPEATDNDRFVAYNLLQMLQ